MRSLLANNALSILSFPVNASLWIHVLPSTPRTVAVTQCDEVAWLVRRN
jgi:hypothetical protein